jgi:hypothetical protein
MQPEDGKAEAEPKNQPSPVDAATLARWCEEARRWAGEAKRKIVGRDLPPGFDPDDEHQYTFRLPGR